MAEAGGDSGGSYKLCVCLCVLHWSRVHTRTGFPNADTWVKMQRDHSESRYQRLTAANTFINPLVPETSEVWPFSHRALEILLWDMPGLVDYHQGQF